MRTSDIVKLHAKDMLKFSKLEYHTYKKDKDITYLMQAGEKLFNAFARYLEYKYQIITHSHNEVRDLAMRDSRNFELMSKFDQLHDFFYHGEVLYKREYIEKTYDTVLKSVENRINNLWGENYGNTGNRNNTQKVSWK